MTGRLLSLVIWLKCWITYWKYSSSAHLTKLRKQLTQRCAAATLVLVLWVGTAYLWLMTFHLNLSQLYLGPVKSSPKLSVKHKLRAWSLRVFAATALMRKRLVIVLATCIYLLLLLMLIVALWPIVLLVLSLFILTLLLTGLASVLTLLRILTSNVNWKPKYR